MEGIKKNAKTAAKIAKIFRNLAMVGLVFCVVGAILSFLMAGFVNNIYYQNPDNIAKAAGSLNADMGFFNFIKSIGLVEKGLYGQYFAAQLICTAVLAAIYFFLFNVIFKNLTSLSENGYAFDKYAEGKMKTSYIVITILMVLFNGVSTGIIVGLILCGLFLATKAGYVEE